MHLREIPPVFLALALAACGNKGAEPPSVPPATPAELTTPASDDGEDDFDDEGGDDDEADGDDEGGFGSSSSEPVPEPTAWMKDAAKKITAHAKGKTRAWDRLADMVDRYGHRLSGSKSLEQAIDWTIATMKKDGLDNVRREKVMVPRWIRGHESLKVVSPVKRDIHMIGLGMSVGTKGTLRAPVAVVSHIDEIAKLEDGALEGKILLINQEMPAYDQERMDSHYGPTVQARTRGASEAAKKGAEAVLVRSVTATSLDTVHTGSLGYQDGVDKIPAAAITGEAAEFLARSVRRAEMKVALKMGAKLLPDSPSANAIGEIRGREKPEEVVVIGGHIDSWDVGEGASDDGAGCMMAIEAAAILKELGMVPRRTIRVVLFTNEENGLRGGKAYFEAHGKEVHAAAIEADAGSGKPWGFGVGGKDAKAKRIVKSYEKLFEGLGAGHIADGGGGADISPLTKIGVLSLSVRPDTSHYFDVHHSPADTVDKIDPDHLQRNAAALALMAYILAERE